MGSLATLVLPDRVYHLDRGRGEWLVLHATDPRSGDSPGAASLWSANLSISYHCATKASLTMEGDSVVVTADAFHVKSDAWTTFVWAVSADGRVLSAR